MDTTEKMEARAAALFPDSPYLQRQWLGAVAYLRARNRWVLEGGKVTWAT